LLDSLDTDVDEDAEATWATAVNRCVAELNCRTVKPIPWQRSAADSPRADAAVSGDVDPLAADEAEAAERWYRERNETAAGQARTCNEHSSRIGKSLVFNHLRDIEVGRRSHSQLTAQRR
jgi:hypothetical protein